VTAFVLDASIAFAWCFADEATPLRLGVPLASKDTELRKSAARLGLALLGV
jgi:hypothetical protein